MAGVGAVAGAGVEGAFEDEDEAAGATLGLGRIRLSLLMQYHGV